MSTANKQTSYLVYFSLVFSCVILQYESSGSEVRDCFSSTTKWKYTLIQIAHPKMDYYPGYCFAYLHITEIMYKNSNYIHSSFFPSYLKERTNTKKKYWAMYPSYNNGNYNTILNELPRRIPFIFCVRMK